MRTEASRLFDEFNRRYFRACLPRYRVIRRTVLRGNVLGVQRDKTRTILLRRDLTGENLQLTLLHEMCHIGTGSGYSHGPRFQKKMRRLIRLGAPSKLLKDVECYDGTEDARRIAAAQAAGTLKGEMPFRDAIKSDLEGLAIVRAGYRWPKVRRFLSEQYKIAPSDIDRYAPWAQRDWRRLSAEYRSIERQQKKRLKAIAEGKLPPLPK